MLGADVVTGPRCSNSEKAAAGEDVKAGSAEGPGNDGAAAGEVKDEPMRDVKVCYPQSRRLPSAP